MIHLTDPPSQHLTLLDLTFGNMGDVRDALENLDWEGNAIQYRKSGIIMLVYQPHLVLYISDGADIHGYINLEEVPELIEQLRKYAFTYEDNSHE